MTLQVRPNRTVMRVLTLLIFISLGMWRWIEMKSEPFSLFDFWGRAILGLSTDLGRIVIGDIMIGLLYLAILTLVYVLISVALGAIIAAIVAAVRSLKEMDLKPNKQVQSIAGKPGSD